MIENEKTEHVDVKIEALMPRVSLNYHVECTSGLGSEGGPGVGGVLEKTEHVDVKIEALMPRVSLNYHVECPSGLH